MFLVKRNIVIFFLFFIASCSSTSFTYIDPINNIGISIETPSDRYNLIFRETLKRNFKSENNLNPQFILRANISYSSTETLSVSGSADLNSTKATIQYSLINIGTNVIVKSGSISSFPSLSSSSSSLFSNDKSVDHIKERLSLSSAKKLYMLIKIVLRKLN